MAANFGTGPFIAVDWGSTRRRAWRIEPDRSISPPLREERGAGALRPEEYALEFARLRAHFGSLPILASGMIGSARGWREVPYVTAPAALADLAEGVVAAADDVYIVPGIAMGETERADVMRGEEVQILGAVESGAIPSSATIVQPGTHCKWVSLEDGRIARFITALTGEVFGLLKQQGALRDMLAGPVTAGEIFEAGVRKAAAEADLLGHLFGLRAAVLCGRIGVSEAPSYVSGLIIGTDVAARDVATLGHLHLLSEGPLEALYRAAIEQLGGTCETVDSDAAFLSGMIRLGSDDAT